MNILTKQHITKNKVYNVYFIKENKNLVIYTQDITNADNPRSLVRVSYGPWRYKTEYKYIMNVKRYITIGKEDIDLCNTVYNDYFIETELKVIKMIQTNTKSGVYVT